MKYFAGLDVSLEETAICVVDETGSIVKEARFASEPDALVVALEGMGLVFERVGLEACSLTAWLHDALRGAGLPAICIETRQANAAMKTMPNKTDRNDARALAQIMRTGWFRPVHVKSRQCRLWRSLLVARRTILNEMRTIENVVRAIMREAGIKLGTPSRAAFADRVRAMVGDDTLVKPLVAPLLTVLATMLDQFSRLTKQVLDLVRKEEVCRRLMSVPGVGPITALAFRATIDRPDRFRRSRDVGAHLGLTPARYQSGETDIQGKISRCGDELARTALYEAAHTLLVRSRKWSSLRAWGMKIAKHRGIARARVAVARKLAVILHRMWSDSSPFRWGKEADVGAVSLLRLGAATAAVGVLTWFMRGSPRKLELLLAAICAVLLGSLAGIGHTQIADGQVRLVHVLSDALHLLGAGAWLGGLVGLLDLIVVSLSGKNTKNRQACEAALNFSTMGYVAVAILVVSGLINSWFLVSSPINLVTTTYGRLLLLKLVLFALMVGFAGLNRFFVVPALVHSVATGAKSGLRWLLINLAAEQSLGFAIVLIVSLLGITEPATTS